MEEAVEEEIESLNFSRGRGMESSDLSPCRDGTKPHTVKIGGSINAMSANPSFSQIVVGGREVLKIVSADTFDGICNIRAGRVNMNYSSTDVKWNLWEQNANLIASAATNGAVVLWNMNLKGKKLERVINDHTRTVNRICWQPDEPWNLLSGSQDGCMRLWDVRTPGVNNVVFNAKSEVRDVQYNPFANYQFAAALENGNIQIWDIRKSLAARWTFPVHQGLVITIAWHPQDQYLLASGGRDRLIKVWDLQSSKDTKLVKMIQTIASVGKITWRPDVQKENLHIASSASLTDISIHVWDLKNPFVPLVTLKGAKDVMRSHMWSDSKTVISCSKDGCMRRHDLKRHGYFPRKHMPTTALSWNIRNELAVASKPIDRSPRLDVPGPPFKASADCATKVRLFEPSESIEEANGSFNHRMLEHFAKHLKFRGGSIEELCSHNHQVAEEARCEQLAHVWKMVQVVYEKEAEEMCERSQSEASSANWPSDFLSGGDRVGGVFLDGKGAVDPSTEFDGKAEVAQGKEGVIASLEIAAELRELKRKNESNPSTETSQRRMRSEEGDCSEENSNIEACGRREDGSSRQELSLKSGGSRDRTQKQKPIQLNQFDDMDWDPASILPDILDYYEQIGDVQTCVIMAFILHQELAIQPRRMLAWVRAYLDLLRRDKMWNSSNHIIKHCHLESVRDMNKMNTSYATKCTICNKAMSDAVGAYCSHCRKTASFCAICNKPVKGIIIWCQVCGHGGHSEHMRQWFSTQANCPMGCGHICQPKQGTSKD